MLEIRGDAWKLMHLQQRPFPTGASDIGVCACSCFVCVCMRLSLCVRLKLMHLQQCPLISVCNLSIDFMSFQLWFKYLIDFTRVQSSRTHTHMHAHARTHMHAPISLAPWGRGAGAGA